MRPDQLFAVSTVINGTRFPSQRQHPRWTCFLPLTLMETVANRRLLSASARILLGPKRSRSARLGRRTHPLPPCCRAARLLLGRHRHGQGLVTIGALVQPLQPPTAEPRRSPGGATPRAAVPAGSLTVCNYRKFLSPRNKLLASSATAAAPVRRAGGERGRRAARVEEEGGAGRWEQPPEPSRPRRKCRLCQRAQVAGLECRAASPVCAPRPAPKG